MSSIPGRDDSVAPLLPFDPRAVARALEAETDHHTDPIAWARFLEEVYADHGEPPPPSAPCFAEPGTEAKIACMRDRFASRPRRALFHRGDLSLNPLDRAGRETHRRGNGTDARGGLRATSADEDRARQHLEELARDRAEVDELIARLARGEAA